MIPKQEEYDNVLETYDEFLSIMTDEGHIPEEHFDLHGIRDGMDIHGNEVKSLANIGQESYQRSKCLTRDRQVELRKERIKQLQRKERLKKVVANNKHRAAVDANEIVVDILCKLMQEKGRIGDTDFGEEHLECCDLEMFSQLKNTQLEAFILAHDPQFQVKSKLPKKGTLEETKEQEDVGHERNRISVAYNCRTKPSLIAGKLPFDLSESSAEEDTELNVETVLLTEDEKPSRVSEC